MNALAPLRLAPGIHKGVPEALYHLDPAQEPSASSGVLRAMVELSPMHARALHPRLGQQAPDHPQSDAVNAGSILHAMILETPPPFVVLDVKEYRTDDAKRQKQDAIQAGLIPLKRAEAAELLDVAASIRSRLQAMPEVWTAMRDAISTGMTEVTLIWDEAGALCRCRYDMLSAARFGATYDLKFTGKVAPPEEFRRTLAADYLYQADLYPRAVRALRGDRPAFVFVRAETEPPYGVSLHAMAPDLADLARRKVERALALWRESRRTGAWPGYPALVHHHEAPGWAVNAWDAREIAEEYAA